MKIKEEVKAEQITSLSILENELNESKNIKMEMEDEIQRRSIERDVNKKVVMELEKQKNQVN
jgi:hypothetical protein